MDPTVAEQIVHFYPFFTFAKNTNKKLASVCTIRPEDKHGSIRKEKNIGIWT